MFLRMKEEYETNLLNLEHQLNIHKTESLEKDDQLKQIQLELESQLDKIKKTPSAMLKMMVEQLKRQLEVKERQIQVS